MLDVRDRPQFTADEARRAADELFGLRAEAKQLPSERDQNFLLIRGGRPIGVLKIANKGEERRVLEFQNAALDHIERRDQTLTVPRVWASLTGKKISTMTGASGDHMVRALSYLEGMPLVKAKPHSPALLRDIGRFMGRLDRALQGFAHHAAQRSLTWSLVQADEVIDGNLVYLRDEPTRRAVVERHLARFRRFTLPILFELRSGIIHNDANDHNLLVHRSAKGDQLVGGLLDFGDMIQSPLVHEAAVAAAYVMQNSADPMQGAANVIGGYNDVFTLTGQEIDVLFDLITIRLCTTVTLAARHAKLEPEWPYLTVSEESSWRILQKLEGTERGTAADYFRGACGWPRSGPHTTGRRNDLLERRKTVIGPSLSLSYGKPLHIVRGFGQYLFSDSGRAYLDCVNNVAHVGHNHPRVVAAGQRQMAILNTNTRYLHDYLLQYAERLTATLPEPLCVCYFVCSGSEANELALRMARTYTGQSNMIVLGGAYHGNTATLIDHSPYKHEGPGGSGRPAHVHKAPMPDPYRGIYSGDGAGQRYAGALQQLIGEIQESREGLAGFICEPLLGCGGQIVPPSGYLRQAFESVRRAGGVCIVDEVQTGFGRVGSHFWAFEGQEVVPDIVTMGKPIGNGHPMAAVVTTPEIATAFANGMEYFNTFGGNPVSCAIGLAVLDVIEQEGLQRRALTVGAKLKEELAQLAGRHALIGDVRGQGLFIGVELVKDELDKRPAADEATEVVERMKARGVLLSTDGPDHNVIKIKPPLVISEADAAYLASQMDNVLAALPG